MLTIRTLLSLTPLCSILATSVAYAQTDMPKDADANEQVPGTPSDQPEAPMMQTTVGVGTDPNSLPAPQSDNDMAPPVAAPSVAAQGVTEQAGVGGTQAYGRAGVLELGGFFNLTSATNFLSVGLNPTIGWFFMDNVEISAILGVNYSKQTRVIPATATTPQSETDSSATALMLLAEPSFHVPFSQHVFGFLGVGFGVSSQQNDPGEDAGTGFAIAPRLGMNVMVGRSGIFTPALTGIFQTSDAISTPQGTVLAVNSSLGINAGYTVMW